MPRANRSVPCTIPYRAKLGMLVQTGYRYADCSLPGGIAKIDLRRLIEGEKGKKKKKRKRRKKKEEEKKKVYLVPSSLTCRCRPRSRFFSQPEARHAMFEELLPSAPGEASIPYDFLIERTEGYSGSDIRLVCKEAAMQPLRRLMMVLEGREDTVPEDG
ncbi:hypothetical protein GW17_00058689 [Ensete ventricosum]|nr:hypothetical protein GW17_00058689 [Ensete ventricosum]